MVAVSSPLVGAAPYACLDYSMFGLLNEPAVKTCNDLFYDSLFLRLFLKFDLRRLVIVFRKRNGLRL